jgi:hypothetical protein
VTDMLQHADIDTTRRGQSAKVSLARWFPVSDRLRTAAYPECKNGPSVSLALLVAEIYQVDGRLV